MAPHFVIKTNYLFVQMFAKVNSTPDYELATRPVMFIYIYKKNIFIWTAKLS
jgi:hypothetical protein